MGTRVSVIGVAVAAAILASAGSASANVYCVDSSGGTCDATYTGSAGFQTALSDAAAHAGADTVKLAAQTYPAPSPTGFNYATSGGDPVAIAGAGQGSTKISVPAPGVVPPGMSPSQFKGLTIQSGADGSSVSDLSIELPAPLVVTPANFPENQQYLALLDDTADLQLSHFAITSPPASPIFADGLRSQGGTHLSHTTITLGPGNGNYPSYGINESDVNDIDLDVFDSAITADDPIRYSNSDPSALLTVDRSTINARSHAVAAEGSNVQISNSVLDLKSNDNAVAFDVGYENQLGTSLSDVTATGLTIAGDGDSQRGLNVHATSDNTPPNVTDTATVAMSSSVIDLRGPNPTAVYRAEDFDGTSNVSIDYSSFDQTTSFESVGGGTAIPGATTLGAHNLSNPQPASDFSDFAAGNYRLDPSSQLIDAGDPADPGPGALDLSGNPRVNNGSGVCPNLRDIGALEAGGMALDCTPPVTTINSGPNGATSAARPTFTYSSLPLATFECRIDGGAFTSCPPSGFTPAAALADGPHTVAVQSTSSTGAHELAPKTRAFAVDTTGPTASVTGKAKVKAKKKRATAVLTLASEPGATFKCQIDAGPAAPCASPFRAARLKPGSHTVTVAATDTLGNSGPAAAFTFKVTKKKKKT